MEERSDKQPSDITERSRSSATNENDGESADRPDTREPTKKLIESSPIEIKGKIRPTTGSDDQASVHSSIAMDVSAEPMPMDQILKTANTMSNMLMAHKIALEDDFRLEPGMDISGPLMSLSPILGSSSPLTSDKVQKGEPSLQSKVKDIVQDAYWDLFKEELESQKNETREDRKYDLFKQLLRDIKQRIIDLLLPQHARLKQEIEDKLDPTIVDQLISVDSLDPLDYARYVLGVLGKLCAPVRDEKLQELNETTDLVSIYRGIMELLELMRLDFANFTLNRFKPHIKAHSQDYEREKFNEILKQQQMIGIDGLEFTKVWLKRAVRHVEEQHGLLDLMNEAVNSSSEEVNPPIITPSEESPSIDKRDRILGSDVVNKILNTAYCELLEWSPEKQRLYPETLLFDEATFKQLGEQYKVLVLTSSILLTTFAFIGKFNLQDNQDFRTLIKSHIITLLTASYDNQSVQTATDNDGSRETSSIDGIDQTKLETVALRLIEDTRQKLSPSDESRQNEFDNQKELFRRQILDLQSESNRIRQLARRRIMEFVDTLLTLDVKHQQKRSLSTMPPPVNIPLGLNCLADEITLTMAQLVKIVRYNRRVFFQHYQDIVADLVLTTIRT